MIKEEDVYKIGSFNKPHGVHGELVFTFVDDAFDNDECDYLFCKLDGIFVPFFIEEYRFRSDTMALMKLEGVDTADQARMFTQVEVYYPKKYADKSTGAALASDYLIGYGVEDRREGYLGQVTKVDCSTLNVLLAIKCGDEELLIPAHEELIDEIDDEKKTIKVNLPEGLLGLNKDNKE